MNEKNSGNLIIIGGAKIKEGKEILKKVAEYINTKEDKMLIATIKANRASRKTYDDIKYFIKLGIKILINLTLVKREDAFNDKNINLIKTINLLFFTGGFQLRITSMIGNSIYNVIKESCRMEA